MTASEADGVRTDRPRSTADSRPAYIMLAVIAVVAVGVAAAWWLSVRPRLTALEEAFENQPPGPVFEPAEFLVGAAWGNEECPQLSTQIFAVDVSDGSLAWEQTVPSPSSGFFGEWYVLASDGDDAVLVQIDGQVGEVPPSVRAIDIATGQLAWQHFLEMGQVFRSAQSESELVMEGTAATELDDVVTVAVDAGGQVADASLVQFDRNRPFDPAIQLGAGYHLTSNVADVLTDGQVVAQVYGGGPDGSRIDIRTVADGATITGDRIPFGDGFDDLGSSSSPGDPIQASDDLILVVIGSPVGPNTRLAVFDGSDGTLKWSIEDTRAGAVAGDDILYDKRNDEPVDAVSTRDLYLVDGDDPDEVVWSTELTVNEIGGNGFLGMAGDDLVFAVESTDVPLEFLVISDEGDVPDLLDAAEGYGAGWGSRHHVDDEIFVAGFDGRFWVQPADGEIIEVETEEPVSWVRRVDDRVLVVASHQQFCR